MGALAAACRGYVERGEVTLAFGKERMWLIWKDHNRWGDDDRHFGPFLYARDSSCRSLAIMLSSGDDEYPGCSLRFSGFGRTLIIALPKIIRPWRENFAKVEADRPEVRARIGDYYYHCHPRKYGFSLSMSGRIGDLSYDFLQVFYGAQTHDSRTDQNWCWFLPWKQWRHVRHSLYDLEGNHFATLPQSCIRLSLSRSNWEEQQAIKDSCPTRTFAFADYDSEELTAVTKIEEREWRRGEGWFKWLSWFYSPRIQRSLDISFSGEVGVRKGSWKGGTVGHGISMLPGELHEAAFRRYCEMNEKTYRCELQCADL